MTLIGWCPGDRTVKAMFDLYPGTTVVRVFVGPNDPLPAWDGPILGPAAGTLVHLSFKAWDLAKLTAWLDAMPEGRQLILTYHHEPEQGKDAGDPPLEVWRTRWAELVGNLADHPRRSEFWLAPTYTRYWWQKNAGNLQWLVAYPGIDAIGWDIYNNGSTYRSPDDLLSIPRDIARRTGLPYLIAELGAVDIGPGRSEWMRAMVDAAARDGAITVCWFHRLEWDLATTAASTAQQTWRELIQEDPMPTYSQLEAEPYWGREVVTPAMDWLGDELCRRTGRPRTAAGTKGDRYHLRGAHRSQEWIKRSRYCTNRTYTVQAGLGSEMERWIAGFDFTPGSVEDMIAQSKRILAAMKRGDLDEVREFYGNVDGDQVVDGWDNLADRAASSDSSHLWHWHLSIDRAHCNNQKLMERILAIALGIPVEDDMPLTTTDINAIATRVWSATWGPTETAGGRLGEARDEARKARLTSEAVLAAVKGLDTKAVLARIEAVAAEERQRDDAEAQRDAELVELVRQAQAGEVDAQAVVDELARRLGTGSPQQ